MIPNFKINTLKGPNPDNMIIDLDGFYNHMLYFILYAKMLHPEENSLWNDEQVLCRFIDEKKNTYTSTLEEDGYGASLEKCLIYFERMEEYEKCKLIKHIQKQ